MDTENMVRQLRDTRKTLAKHVEELSKTKHNSKDANIHKRIYKVFGAIHGLDAALGLLERGEISKSTWRHLLAEADTVR